MPDAAVTAWKCGVCGYIHRGSEPPEWCPVCGAPREDFEPYVEPAPVRAAAVTRWRCLNCNYVHVGPEPPEECPVCGAPRDRFEPLEEEAPAAAPTGAVRKAVVVGAGIAGIAAVESLRAAAPDADIVLVSKELELPYYRLNLTRFLAGELGEADLHVHPDDWYAQHGVRLVRGAEVSNIAPDRHRVELTAGEPESYEKLILTTGAHPFVPPFPGVNREGVTPLRTLRDARLILESARPGVRCVVIGGGLLGLETAGALARRGIDVVLFEGHGWILPRQLNERAGRILESYVLSTGIAIRHKARTAEILGDERARAVLLDDGASVPADLVVVTTGIRPNSYLARLAGLEAKQGVLVDNYLSTTVPDVLAAGDVAEHQGVVYGTWVASKSQGGIAGMNAAGARVEFGGIPRSNTLKVLGMDLFSIGRVEPEDASYDVVEQERDGRYFRFLFRDSFMAGAILLGDTSATTNVKKAVENRTDFSGLLRAKPSADDVVAFLQEHE